MTKHAKEIAEAMGFTYLFEDWARANFRFDRLRAPYLLELLPTAGSFHYAAGRVFNPETRLFGFYDKCALDFDSAEAFAIVERMKAAALKFVSELNKTGDFEAIGTEDLRYNVQFDSYDVNVCGILLTLNLTELPGYCDE